MAPDWIPSPDDFVISNIWYKQLVRNRVYIVNSVFSRVVFNDYCERYDRMGKYITLIDVVTLETVEDERWDNQLMPVEYWVGNGNFTPIASVL